jgi:hypothetical protein
MDAKRLALFVRFVRLNPRLAADDPVILRTFEAYRRDPFPLLDEVEDPSALPTPAEWLAAGAPMREVES